MSTELGAVLRSFQFLLTGDVLSPPYSAEDADPTAISSSDARLYFQYRSPELKLVAHNQLTLSIRSHASSSPLALGRGLSPPRWLPLDFSHREGNMTMTSQVDWLYGAYTVDPLTFTVGRQPITFGRGTLWRTADRISTFALTVTVLEEVTEVLYAAMGFDQDWSLAGDFWDAVRDMTVQGWAFALEHPELAALWKGIGALPHKARREGRLGEYYDRFRSITRAMLEGGQRRGQVRTDLPIELLVELITTLEETLDFWFLEHLDEVADTPAEEVVSLVLDIWKRLLHPAEDETT